MRGQQLQHKILLSCKRCCWRHGLQGTLSLTPIMINVKLAPASRHTSPRTALTKSSSVFNFWTMVVLHMGLFGPMWSHLGLVSHRTPHGSSEPPSMAARKTHMGPPSMAARKTHVAFVLLILLHVAGVAAKYDMQQLLPLRPRWWSPGESPGILHLRGGKRRGPWLGIGA